MPTLAIHDVDGLTEAVLRGDHHRLAERGVRVDGQADVFQERPHLHPDAAPSSGPAPWLMSSSRSGLTMCMPTIWCVFLSATILMKPSVSATAMARPLAAKGMRPICTSIPFSLACASVSPTEAISGSVNV